MALPAHLKRNMIAVMDDYLGKEGSRSLEVEPLPEEWTVKDASEKKRKAKENHDRGPGKPRRAERSTGEENNNLRLVEGGRGGGGGEEDLVESGGEESQESG